MLNSTPSDEIFNELKEASKVIWNTYDNTYGYVTEKLERVDSIRNYEDNAMVFYRMFDYQNQQKMIYGLSNNALKYIEDNQ